MFLLVFGGVLSGCIFPQALTPGASQELDVDDTVSGGDDSGREPEVLESYATLVGMQHSLAGYAVQTAGDVNGDGYGDLLVGAPGFDPEDADHADVEMPHGLAYLVYGPVEGDVDLTTASAVTFRGVSMHDGVGIGLAAGDTNGDGVREVVLGAPFTHVATGSSGTVYLVDTFTPDILLTHAPRTDGDASGDAFGWRVRSAELSGDGADEIVVGAPYAGGDDEGAVRILSNGGPEAKLLGRLPNGWLGYEVLAGDIDGDGVGDVLAAAPGDDGDAERSGAVYAWYGPLSGLLSTLDADVWLSGVATDDVAGTSLAKGDLNADGHVDVAVGAPKAEGVGAVYVLSGPFAGMYAMAESRSKLLGTADGDEVGGSVALLGDVDGDGTADLSVGAPGTAYDGPDMGAAYLVLGPTEGTVELGGALLGMNDQHYARLGSTVTAVGDVQGDGAPVIAVGAPGGNYNGGRSGAVFLFGM